MKSNREVQVSNIVDGKRHRVMSYDAVNAFVAQDFQDNILGKFNKQSTIKPNKDIFKNLKQVGKQKKSEGKISTQNKSQTESRSYQSNQHQAEQKVKISKKALEILIDEYFIVVSSSSEGESNFLGENKELFRYTKIRKALRQFRTGKSQNLQVLQRPANANNFTKQIKDQVRTNSMNEGQEKIKNVEIKNRKKLKTQVNQQEGQKITKQDQFGIPDITNLLSQILSD